MSLNRMFGFVFGAVYLLVGLVGFAVTNDVGFAAREGNELLIFELNPLHNIVHLGVGALLLAGAIAGLSASKAVNFLVGAVYLAVGIVGLFFVGGALGEYNLLAINHPDNGLHIATALLALGVSIFGDRRAAAPGVSDRAAPARRVA